MRGMSEALHGTLPAPATAPPAATDHWITLPTGRLFARRFSPPDAQRRSPGQPEAPHAPAPIVLFHDSLGCVALWRDFPAALCAATGRSVVAYDRLGFGQSDARQGALPLHFVEEEARTSLPALRAQLGIGRYVALGHSVGGGMAAHCAAADGPSGDCEALITIAAQAFVEQRTLQGIRDARDQFAQHPGQMDRLARYHGGSGERARWVLNAWVDTWLSPGFARWSLQPALSRVACPLLVLHGERDEYGSAAQPEQIARWAAGPAEVRLLAGLAHVPHREQPQAVAALAAQFLAAVPAPR